MSTSVNQAASRGLLELREACEYLRISDYLIRKLIHEQRIPNLKLGRAYYFRRESLDAFLADQERARVSSDVPMATVPQAAPTVAPTSLPVSRREGLRKVPQNL